MSDKGTVEKLIEIAKTEIGYIEGPKDNQTKYGAFTKANFQPWCGSFVMWCANKAGVEIPNTVYTPAGAAAFKKAKRWYDAQDCDPQPGDIAYFDFPGDGVNRISHVGIVVKNNNDGTVVCIEGNTTKKKSGDQRNGGEVCRQIRAYKANGKGLQVNIVGFGRPKYRGAEKASIKLKAPVSKPKKCPTCKQTIK